MSEGERIEPNPEGDLGGAINAWLADMAGTVNRALERLEAGEELEPGSLRFPSSDHLTERFREMLGRA